MDEQYQSCEKVIAFGDGDYLFRLPLKWLVELEAKCDSGIGAIYARVLTFQHSSTDVCETIRCGLIGGGCETTKAKKLIETYVDGFPLDDAHKLAISILAGCVHGYGKGDDAGDGDEAEKKPDSETHVLTWPVVSATEPSSDSPPNKLDS